MEEQKVITSLRAAELIGGYLQGELNEREKTALLNWLDEAPANLEIFQDLVNEKRLEQYKRELDIFDTAIALKKSKEKVFGSETPVATLLWKYISVAAAVLILTGVGFFYYTSKSVKQTGQTIAYGDDVAPGKHIAILKLASGKTISLSDIKTGVVINTASLTYNDGAEVDSSLQKGTRIQPLEIHTPRGGTYQVILSDGSKIWLNAASTLKFPSTFTGLANRKVELCGEAYFEVSKDKNHPFLVETEKQTVKVLGTHFNISAYHDELATKTTLLEGSVIVRHAGINSASQNGKTTIHNPGLHQQDVMLEPGQQSILAGNNTIKVTQADLEEAVAWKNGYFKFNESLESIMNKVSRWYNVEVIYEISPGPDMGFVGKISKTKPLSALLKIIESTNGGVHFKIEGRRITVKK